HNTMNHRLPGQTFRLRALLRGFAILILAAAGLALHAPAVHAAAAAASPVQAFALTLNQIDKQLAKGEVNEETLKGWSDQLALERTSVVDCIANTEQTLARLKADLATLGEPAKNDAADVVRKRRELGKAIGDVERQQAECRVLALRSDELWQRISTLYKAELAERVFAKGPNLFEVVVDNWHNAVTLLAATGFFVREHAGLDNLSAAQWIWLGVMVVAAFGIGTVVRKRQRPKLADRIVAADGTVSSSASLLAALLHYLPRLMAAFTAAGFVYLATYAIRPVPFINVVLYGLPVYVFGLLCIHLALAPRPPAQRLIAVNDALALGMARRLKVLALLAYVGYLAFSTLFSQHLPDEAYLLTRGLYATLLFLNMIWAMWLFARMREHDELRWVGLLMSLVLVVSLGAEWLGYRNLALMLLRVVLGSLVALGATLLIARVLSELYDAFDSGEGPWGIRMRHWLNVAPGRTLPGLIWFRLVANVLIWVLFGYALLRIWHIPASTLSVVEDTLIRGFTLGNFQVVPYRILTALVLFAVLVALARWLQTRMERHWLRYARMDHGAREAAVTIAGYVMIVVAALIGLSIAGFNFGNLAIIAGALSVGIGFGLQNIVNNFVSGLILLFERPLRTGDWVVVGSTEGYVKKISMRSTQIQTFDRADVIVPNSELISQQVTNWMLHDTRGRIRVPIGVAYGTDPQKVKAVLERVAADHTSVVTDGTVPAPKVLFMGFGDSSLNFELRCFVRNVDDRLQVISDMNYAIEAAFRAEGIEIPFPQRDVHVRNWPKGFGEGMARGDGE
ncbi:MAG TPA: mechanosensitive ion channel domain-containing protein, partial [Gammaproteobacteria bacterium]